MTLTICNFIRNPGLGGKFVVFVRRDGEDGGVAAFSDFGRDFQHRDIVTRWEEAEKRTLATSGLRTAGGGWWKYEGELLVLYGQSAAYGRFNPDWLRQRLRPGMVMYERKIDVR